MYKNLKVERLVELLKEWRKDAVKRINEGPKSLGITDTYWDGQLSIIDQMLQVINIFK
jgi:hypothetical protein